MVPRVRIPLSPPIFNFRVFEGSCLALACAWRSATNLYSFLGENWKDLSIKNKKIFIIKPSQKL
ncbi:hypothetical protein B6D52_02450 [Candidatus Parcubacteria bacterium 4484_255]|nr:MAG: hypothetical protein B6D52_02450 [Candidatus Parcubacteria bacterium 4484_255]